MTRILLRWPYLNRLIILGRKVRTRARWALGRVIPITRVVLRLIRLVKLMIVEFNLVIDVILLLLLMLLEISLVILFHFLVVNFVLMTNCSRVKRKLGRHGKL